LYKNFLMDSAFCLRIGHRFGRHYSVKRDILNVPKLDDPVGGVSMKLTFLGANHEVTGSCTLLEAAGQRYLIDCGMEQGKDVYENQPIPVAPGEIDGVLATHAHIDHTGLLPLLVRNGFRGRIYATRPTAELCSIMLRDSAHIQEFEAEWKNRKGQRSGAEPVEPMYTIQDAEAAIALFRGYDYNKEIELAPGIVIRFVDVGHLLGSSSIEIWVTENGATTKLVFSGDIGNLDQPIIKDPTYLKDADYVFMESTYGDRSHGPRPDYVAELAKILQRTFDRGGNVVIPSFAVGRTQELLYFIREIKEKNLVTGHGCFPVYIDSPLAIEATRIFKDTDSSCFDEETNALLAKGIDPIQFPGLKVSVTSDESRAINTDPVPKVIISASGMCEAGRIRHHLKHNLWRKECTILFVGYQAVNTLGRSLLEGADNVKLFGESIEVQAEICQLTGLSGHADREGLLKWVDSFEPKPKRVFIIHGEDEVENIFAQTLTEQGFNACAPYNGEQWAIGAEGAVCLKEGTRIRIEHHISEGAARAATVFQRLLNAGKRLLRVIEHNEGGANKDLAKFADQINALCDKWDR
jgi:metallo-beta-lactamase family protein